MSKSKTKLPELPSAELPKEEVKALLSEAKVEAAKVTPPVLHTGEAGLCNKCGQASCEDKHIRVQLSQDVILNGVKYPAGATCLYPANADFFSAVMTKKE